MTPQHEEAERFLRLAKRDQAAFKALLNVTTVDPAVACFHAQQAAEKALKAVMCLHSLEFRRTHDLEALAGILNKIDVTPPVADHDLRCLTPYAVEFRYDDAAIHLISGEAAGQLISAVLAWAEDEIANHRNSL